MKSGPCAVDIWKAVVRKGCRANMQQGGWTVYAATLLHGSFGSTAHHTEDTHYVYGNQTLIEGLPVLTFLQMWSPLEFLSRVMGECHVRARKPQANENFFFLVDIPAPDVTNRHPPFASAASAAAESGVVACKKEY